jgi:aspartate kinase
VDDTVSKVSIVGAGMQSNPGVAAKMFEALYEKEINIRMISTSEIKISVLIDRDKSKEAVRAIHDAFYGEE